MFSWCVYGKLHFIPVMPANLASPFIYCISDWMMAHSVMYFRRLAPDCCCLWSGTSRLYNVESTSMQRHIQRRIKVDATSWRCIDFDASLSQRCVPAGFLVNFCCFFFLLSGNRQLLDILLCCIAALFLGGLSVAVFFYRCFGRFICNVCFVIFCS